MELAQNNIIAPSRCSYEPLYNTNFPIEDALSDPLSIASNSKKIRKEHVKLTGASVEDEQKRKRWKPSEDSQLMVLMTKFGPKWTKIGRIIGGRTGKQVRDRFLYTLNPEINKDKWTEEEDMLLLALHEKMGNKWNQIAPSLPGRSGNQLKNRYNSLTKKPHLHKNLNLKYMQSTSNSDTSDGYEGLEQQSTSEDTPRIKMEDSTEDGIPMIKTDAYEGGLRQSIFEEDSRIKLEMNTENINMRPNEVKKEESFEEDRTVNPQAYYARQIEGQQRFYPPMYYNMLRLRLAQQNLAAANYFRLCQRFN